MGKYRKEKKCKKTCSPEMCDCAIYLGEGDFACDKKGDYIMVMEDWEPTDKYLWCNGGKKE